MKSSKIFLILLLFSLIFFGCSTDKSTKENNKNRDFIILKKEKNLKFPFNSFILFSYLDIFDVADASLDTSYKGIDIFVKKEYKNGSIIMNNLNLLRIDGEKFSPSIKDFIISAYTDGNFWAIMYLISEVPVITKASAYLSQTRRDYFLTTGMRVKVKGYSMSTIMKQNKIYQKSH